METRELVLTKTDPDIDKVICTGPWIFSPSGRYAVSFYEVDIGYNVGIGGGRTFNIWNVGVIVDFDDVTLRYYDGLRLGVCQHIYRTYFLDDDRLAVFYGKDKCLFHRSFTIDRVNKTAKSYARRFYNAPIYPYLVPCHKSGGVCSIHSTDFSVLVQLCSLGEQFSLLLFLNDPRASHPDLTKTESYLKMELDLYNFELSGIRASVLEVVPYPTGNKIFLRIVRDERETDHPIVFAVIDVDKVDFSRGKTQYVKPERLKLDINFNKFSQIGSLLISERTNSNLGTSIIFAELDSEKFVPIPLKQIYRTYSTEVDVGVDTSGHAIFITPTVLGKIIIARIKIPFDYRDDLHNLVTSKLTLIDF